MKGVYFNQPLEWIVDLRGESWQQGQLIQGELTVKNHSTLEVDLTAAGVALAYGEVKKVHARHPGALVVELRQMLSETHLPPSGCLSTDFKLQLSENSPISDKKSSYFLLYGREMTEANLQLKVEPRKIFVQIIGLFETFLRFKVKEIKSGKTGVEFKLIPPTSREFTNVETLTLSLALSGEMLRLEYIFNVRRLDTTGITNKIKKETLKQAQEFSPKHYSLGPTMINQDQLFKGIEAVLSEVKLKSVF